MTNSNSKYDLTFIVSTLEQLQAEQDTWKDNTIWLKRYFDELKQEFQTRPTKDEVDKMQEVVSQLTAQVNKLKQRIDNIASNTHSNNVDMLNAQQEETHCSTIEEQFGECNDEDIHQNISIDDSIITENICNTTENEQSQEINILEGLEEDSKGLSNKLI